MYSIEKMKLRRLLQKDLPVILEWRNQYDVRKMMKNKRIISKKEHQDWFFNVDKDNTCEWMVVEYDGLDVGVTGITNLSDYTIQLGRRFRALKLWFLLRAEGLSGLRKVIRDHIKWSTGLHDSIKELKNVEILTRPILGLFTFRFLSEKTTEINELNEKILQEINDEGTIYLTPTKVNDNYVIRFTAGTFELKEEDVHLAYKCIRERSEKL